MLFTITEASDSGYPSCPKVKVVVAPALLSVSWRDLGEI
jgi:hypothetical protein